MTLPITRRAAIAGSLLLGSPLLAAIARAASPGELQDALGALERTQGGRLGVAILDSANGTVVGQRGDERFALSSTFKLLAAACVLARVDRGEESLDRRVVFAADDLVTYSPVTEKRTGGDGMTLAELCHAAITISDNTAGNLLLASFGGPEGLTGYLRSLGDGVSRLDRWETALNEATPGDPRDTTTPNAMLGNLRRLLLEDALAPASRDRLVAWLVANETGGSRIRAGLPAGWRVGDKTGTGGHGTTNDVAVLWPPGRRQPLLVAAYYADSDRPQEERNAVLAEVGRIAAALA